MRLAPHKQYGKSTYNTLPQHFSKVILWQGIFLTPSYNKPHKIYLKNWAKLTQDGHILSIVKGFKFFSPEHIWTYSTSNYKVKTRRETTDKFRDTGNLEERYTSTGATKTIAMSGQLVFSGKKDGGHRPVTNLKYLNAFIPYQHFLNGGDVFNKGSSSGKQFSNKNRSKTCLFWYFSWQNIKEICLFSMGREFIQIPLLMFLPRTSPSDFCQTFKGPNCFTKRNKCEDNNSRDNILVIAQTLKELIQASESLNFLLQKSGFASNLQKS